jgi:hypothetical protein
VIVKNIEVLNGTLELTWEGYDFINSIRKDTIWKKLKSKIHFTSVQNDFYFVPNGTSGFAFVILFYKYSVPKGQKL